MSRRRAREKAIQALYQMGISQVPAETAVENVILASFEQDAALSQKEQEFLKQLVKGTMEHMTPIDERLRPYLRNWRLERLSLIDRSILRLAVFEMFYLGIPYPVAIDEAVELSKRFSTAESKIFVNGILSQMVKGVRRE